MSFSIPTTNLNPDMSAAVLEAMASYSYRDTLPTYLDLALKGKYMNDASSRKMVDLIVSGFRVDAGWIYALSTGGLGNTFRGAVWENSSQFASDFTKALQKTKVTTKEIKNKYSKIWES
ncbi:MAG: hypothetical protein J5933_02370 [Clostridia bacterium]|nr:hypothetical protein [Clostridia bacterium]